MESDSADVEGEAQLNTTDSGPCSSESLPSLAAVVAILGPGDSFGEIALIKDTQRTATVTTLGECQLLTLEVSDFRRLMAQYPDLKAAIERIADERLRQLSGASRAEEK